MNGGHYFSKNKAFKLFETGIFYFSVAGIMASSQDAILAEKKKVTINLKPVGNAPTLTKSKFSVPVDRQVSWIQQWLKKTLKCEPDDSMFVYVAQAFSPSPDITVQTLHKCYGIGDKLILHYCKTPAWG